METAPELVPYAQRRVLAAAGPHASLLTLSVAGPREATAGLRGLAEVYDPKTTVIAVGAPLADALGRAVPGLRPFRPVEGVGVRYPATQGALWVAVYGAEPGALVHQGRRLLTALGPGWTVEDEILAYNYREGRDLSGYLDGTANPVGLAATLTALCDGPPGLRGSSFVFTQRWVHDLVAYDGLDTTARDHMIGRRISDNEEIADAPDRAHVKRTAQEDVGFLLRRSMPWGGAARCGLAFVAYAVEAAIFERHLARMSGLDDGIVDALNQMSQPVTGGLYWCPPVAKGRLDLRLLGL